MKKSTRALCSRAFVSVISLACATVAFAQTAPEAGADSSASSEQPVTDSWITAKVKTELATTDGVKSTDVDVKTTNGVVTLTGVLAHDIAVKKAVAAAQSVKGVRRVDASGLKSKD